MVNKTLAGIILASLVTGVAIAQDQPSTPPAAPATSSDTGSTPAPKGEKGKHHHKKKMDEKGKHHRHKKGDKKKGGEEGGAQSTPAPAATPSTPAQ